MSGWIGNLSIVAPLIAYSSLLFLVSCATLTLIKFYIQRDKAIDGFPLISSPWPIIGNLFQIGPSPCLTYWKWAQQVGPLFQIRFGIKRFIIVNSYDDAKFLWVDEMSSNCSRPISYTFHDVVSASQGLTIGTTPWGATHKRKRRAAAFALNQKSIRSYMSIIDFESAICINEIFTALRSKSILACNSDIDVRQYFNTFSLNTSLTLGYGTRISELDKGLLKEIMQVEKAVGRFRGAFSSNYQDYFPFLRWIPSFLNSDHATAVDIRIRRDNYMDALLANLRKEIQQGIARECVIGNILQIKQAYPGGIHTNALNITKNALELTEAELKSVCLTMVSAGLDTIPGTLIFFLGHMSHDYGKEIQDKAWNEICNVYSDNEPWISCLDSEYRSLPYIHAIMKESLRFSGMPLSLPRETIRDIHFDDHRIIPRGSTLVLNSFAANFDPQHFHDPYTFRPERYLKSNSHIQHAVSSGPAHFSFGAGLRMCCGAMLAERELFTAIVRLISSFEILEPDSKADLMSCDPFELYKEQTSLMIDPPPFKIKLRPRDPVTLERWINSSICADSAYIGETFDVKKKISSYSTHLKIVAK